MDFLWIIMLVAVIVFIAEKTGSRFLNFGAFGLLMYLAFQQDDVFLIGILIFIAFAIMIYSLFGKD